jgi:hypothetical protein
VLSEDYYFLPLCKGLLHSLLSSVLSMASKPKNTGSPAKKDSKESKELKDSKESKATADKDKDRDRDRSATTAAGAGVGSTSGSVSGDASLDPVSSSAALEEKISPGLQRLAERLVQASVQGIQSSFERNMAAFEQKLAEILRVLPAAPPSTKQVDAKIQADTERSQQSETKATPLSRGQKKKRDKKKKKQGLDAVKEVLSAESKRADADIHVDTDAVADSDEFAATVAVLAGADEGDEDGEAADDELDRLETGSVHSVRSVRTDTASTTTKKPHRPTPPPWKQTVIRTPGYKPIPTWLANLAKYAPPAGALGNRWESVDHVEGAVKDYGSMVLWVRNEIKAVSGNQDTDHTFQESLVLAEAADAILAGDVPLALETVVRRLIGIHNWQADGDSSWLDTLSMRRSKSGYMSAESRKVFRVENKRVREVKEANKAARSSARSQSQSQPTSSTTTTTTTTAPAKSTSAPAAKGGRKGR